MILTNNQHLKISCPSILKKLKTSHGYRISIIFLSNKLRRVSKRLIFSLDPLCVWFVHMCMYVCMCVCVCMFMYMNVPHLWKSQDLIGPPCVRQGLLFTTAYGKLTGSQASVLAYLCLHVSIGALELQMMLPCMACVGSEGLNWCPHLHDKSFTQ